MGVKYNPFAGNLDIVDSPSGDFSDIEISGDLTLGTGTPVTTVQAVTPTANRTISFPDQTGTVALVAGATGAIQYNESGAQTGTVDFAVDPDWNNASTTFTGLKLNVTDTASAADSKLVDIQSNGTSKVVVDDDGNLGIGTTNPQRLLHLARSSTNPDIRLSGATSTSGFEFVLEDTSGLCFITARETVGQLVFRTGGNNERLRITSDAYVRLASGTGGIQFNGDTAAANALDDYEEGSFSPTIIGTTTAGTATYTTQGGHYTKVGRLVTFTAYLNWSGGTGAGNMQIGGLPFAPLGVGSNYNSVSFGLVDNITLPASRIIGGYVNNATSTVILTSTPVGGGSYANLAYDAAGHFIVSGSYFAA